MPQGGEYTEMSEFERPTMFIWVVKSKLGEPRWQEKTNPSKPWSVDPLLVSFTTCRSALIKKQGKQSPQKDQPCCVLPVKLPQRTRFVAWPREQGSHSLPCTSSRGFVGGNRPRTFCTPHTPTWSPDCTLGGSTAPQVRTWKLFSCAHPPTLSHCVPSSPPPPPAASPHLQVKLLTPLACP